LAVLWASQLRGALTEVPLRCGVADIVTDSHVFEVKTISGWKSAIGQALVYAGELNRKPALILYYSVEPSEEKLHMIDEACGRLGVLCIFREANVGLLDEMYRA
jgi:hypothetical protein